MELTQKMQYDRSTILVAVTTELYPLIKREYSKFLDSVGYYEFYKFIIELVDEMMFTEGSAYLAYIEMEERGADVDWHTLFNNCFDWYFIDLAISLVKERLKDDKTPTALDGLGELVDSTNAKILTDSKRVWIDYGSEEETTYVGLETVIRAIQDLLKEDEDLVEALNIQDIRTLSFDRLLEIGHHYYDIVEETPSWMADLQALADLQAQDWDVFGEDKI